MNEHSHSNETEKRTPETPMDPGSHALNEALRSSFGIVRFVMVALVLVFIGSGFFQVGPQEQALILRLGKPVGEGQEALLGPGLHFSWPYPIDEYVKVRVSEIQKTSSSVGWYYSRPELEIAGREWPAGPSLNPVNDGYAITADANIVHIRGTLNYRIEDPVRYVFGFVNASNVVHNALNNAILFASAQFKVDDILVGDVAGFRDAVRRRATELLTQQDVGVVVEDCFIESIPPRQVKPAFDAVIAAGQNRNKALYEAHSYENQVLSRAMADAAARTNLAESERVRAVSSVSSQAERFTEILPRFRSNPDLFRSTYIAGTLARISTNLQEKVYLPGREDGNLRELRLLLNREPPKVQSEPSPHSN